VDCGDSSSMDEFSYVMGTYESSECSSTNSSEEQIEPEQLIEPPNHMAGLETKYLSALTFSMSTSMDISSQKPRQFKKSFDIASDSHGTHEITDCLCHDVHSQYKDMFLSNGSMLLESRESCTSDIQHTDTLPDKAWPPGQPQKQLFNVFEGYGDNSRSHPADSQKLSKRNVGVIKEGTSYFSKTLATLNASLEEASGKGQQENPTYSPYSYTLQQWKPNYRSNFLSMNPMLTNYALLHSMSKLGERCSTDYGCSLPYFDFTSVEDPCKLSVELGAGSGHEFGSELLLHVDSHASSTSSKSEHHGKQGHDGDHVLFDNTEVCHVYSPSDLKGHNQEVTKNVSGGSNWETLLGTTSDTIDNSVGGHRQILSAMFEIPLDFIIEKCLQQEIMLQYPCLIC
jgi:gamma-tubulin complex component 6